MQVDLDTKAPELIELSLAVAPVIDKPLFMIWLNFSEPVKLDVALVALTNAVALNMTAHYGLMAEAAAYSMWLQTLSGMTAVVTVPGLAYQDAQNNTGLKARDIKVSGKFLIHLHCHETPFCLQNWFPLWSTDHTRTGLQRSGRYACDKGVKTMICVA